MTSSILFVHNRFLHKLLRFYSSVNKRNVYSNTIILPATKFPLRNDDQKSKLRNERLTQLNEKLYNWQETHLHSKEFILHDGPPYANGAPHMGHAINKILKDIIVRCNLLKGRKINYIPGWDCHGLPIELKAIKNNSNLSAIEIRQTARNFAKQTIEKQRAAFESWGVLGDWRNSYKTFDKNYIRNQLQQFFALYEKKLVYRDFKPVHWSPSSRTALAEAELEYNNEHKSHSTTLKFKCVDVPEALNNYKPLHLLIWTTTPWTLPANQAVCYNKDLFYSVIQDPESMEYFVIASDLVEAHNKLMQKSYNVLLTFPGEILRDSSYEHPIYNHKLPILHSSHATNTKGTGLVHTAPAHGPEDFLVALDYKISIKSLVDENGRYSKEAGENLHGLDVLDKGMKTVLGMVQDNILKVEDFIHSYPYDWRTKKPIIFRASKQWFIDTNPIKEKAVELLKDVEIIPKVNSEKYKNNLIQQIQKRPYWCISRQRMWGVPIPVFYEKSSGNHFLNQRIIDHLCDLLMKHDTDFWWKLPLDEMLPESLLKEYGLKPEEISKGEDILDIWFDSGISWSSVLKGDQIADMYLEGVDQFTGWFQSSLITSAALRNKAPFKNVYVHGFALDENGLKMSKSLGNVIDPNVVISGDKKEKAYGVDALRWWVACHANYDSTAHISKNVLQSCSDEIQKIRSVLRFALGALNDYKPEEFDYNSLNLVDKYLLHVLYNFKSKADQQTEAFEFHKLCFMVVNILTNEISALYYTTIKDRLYCDPADSFSRRSSQYLLYNIFHAVTESIAPILPHLVEELYDYLPQKESDFYFTKNMLQIPSQWNNPNVANLFKVLLNIKQDINKLVGSRTIDQDIDILVSEQFNFVLQEFGVSNNELCDLFQLANINIIVNNQNEDYRCSDFIKTKSHLCDRCRKYNSDKENELCKRCKSCIENMERKIKVEN